MSPARRSSAQSLITWTESSSAPPGTVDAPEDPPPHAASTPITTAAEKSARARICQSSQSSSLRRRSQPGLRSRRARSVRGRRACARGRRPSRLGAGAASPHRESWTARSRDAPPWFAHAACGATPRWLAHAWPCGQSTPGGETSVCIFSRIRLTFIPGYTNIRSMPVTCARLPRFRLATALAEPGQMNRPAALAPEPRAAQLIGEVSPPAERFGLRAGMRMGEALSRCSELVLVPPDHERAERRWEEALRQLEGIGAAVESDRPGEAFFEAAGLGGLWGGPNGVLDRARAELGSSVRLGLAPGRFCSYVAASLSGERPTTVPDGGASGFLASLPVSFLYGRLSAPREDGRSRGPDEDADSEDLPNELERLGIATLGRLAGLPRDAVADRFGRLGLHAQRLARGQDQPLRPRRVREAIAVELELPEAVSGQQLDRALELLIARLLAHPGRRGRTIRALRLPARLAAGGGWMKEVALRRAASDRTRLTDALRPRLAFLPAPAATLRLEAVGLGPAAGEQLSLSSPEEERRLRISEAVRQTRSAAGLGAVLRVLEVDPGSRIPERREVLMPWPEGAP